MYKRLVSLILCVLILLTGCNRPLEIGDIDKQGDENDEVEIKDETMEVSKDDIEEEDLTLVWKEIEDYENVEVSFNPKTYTPNVPNYEVKGNLSNIDRFEGFTDEQIKKLKENGFIVLEPNPDRANQYMKMYSIYEANEYLNIPSFITVDTSLHIYHKFFNETLKQIEREKLIDALKELSKNMLYKSKILYDQDSNAVVKDELEDIIIYFSVANKLINDTYGYIPEGLKEVAEKEIDEINKAQGYGRSPLFGFDINYEQFIPRGHYDGDEELEKYFKTMMWYGLIGYPFKDNNGYNYESITKALLITYISFLERDGIDDIALWDKIYEPTNLFVGQSDDITILDLKDLIINVYGEKVKPEDFKDEVYKDKLIEEIEKLPEPQIQYRLITGRVDTPTEKQFRFMGQRYTLDGNIMQELMFPITRPVPTGLDVAAAFGNERAEALVKDGYLNNLEPEKYSEGLEKLKDKVADLKEGDWKENLYNGCLWVLKSIWANKKEVDGLPLFMKNQAWYDKNLQTGLGSYAELKHDTVLYAKQPVAEMGGGEEPKGKYPNYVEPAVEVYDKLLWLVRYSKANLEKRGLLSERGELALKNLEEIYILFRDCSIKELENIPLTDRENSSLRFIGGDLERIDILLSEEHQRSLSSAVISDVAGIADIGSFLEVGTGLPNEIYVALYDQGRIYLARGATYSYYEFLSGKPLTNREWHEKLGIEIIKEYDWEYETINPDKLMKDLSLQPDWIRTFKSFDKNRVDITPIEYKIE